MTEQFEAVHVRHDQIRNDYIRAEICEPFQGFPPVTRQLDIKVTLGKYGGQGGSLPLVVIDDQDSARNCRLSEHHANQDSWNSSMPAGRGRSQNSLKRSRTLSTKAGQES